MNRRRMLLSSLGVVLLGLVGWLLVPRLRFPPDTTPEGAYMRIASSIGADEPEECFAYLEQDAQDAVYSMLDYGTKAHTHIEQHFPTAIREKALAPYERIARAADPKSLWALLAADRGWIRRLRKDLSGVARVEVVGERATIVTARGTRYPFRRRPNGIWGLTIFSAELLADSERTARDWDRIQQVAKDYARGTNP